MIEMEKPTRDEMRALNAMISEGFRMVQPTDESAAEQLDLLVSLADKIVRAHWYERGSNKPRES